MMLIGTYFLHKAIARRLSGRKLSSASTSHSGIPKSSRWLHPSKFITSSTSAATLHKNLKEMEERRLSEGGERFNKSLGKTAHFSESQHSLTKPRNPFNQFSLYVNQKYKSELRRRSASPSIIITSENCQKTTNES